MASVNSQLNLLDLPPEILLQIFYYLGEARNEQQLLSGLSCSKWYNILKGEYPEPIQWWRCSPLQLENDPKLWPFGIRFHIKDWLGVNYREAERFTKFFPFDWRGTDVLFLNKAVYGQKRGRAEVELDERWWDYKLFHKCDSLLRPYNIPAKEWYAHAFDVFRKWEAMDYQVKLSRDMCNPAGTPIGLPNGCPSMEALSKTFKKYLRHYEPFWGHYEEWRVTNDF